MDNKLTKTHYVCTGGCDGVGDKQDVCNAEDCADYRRPLKVCNCIDGRHTEKFIEADEELRTQ